MTARERIEAVLLYLKDRRTAYGLSFGSAAGQVVMSDLLHFSKWMEGPPASASEAMTQRILGRQDVIRRINQHMHLDVEQLFALYNGQQLPHVIQQTAHEESDDD